MNKKFLVAILGLAFATGAQASSKSIEDRVSELEANQMLNTFKFSGTFINRMDFIDKKVQDADCSTSGLANNSCDNLKYNRMRLMLNINADVNDHLQFYSTLMASKSWNLFYKQGVELNNSATANWFSDLGTVYNGTSQGVLLEKAYFDYSMKSLPVVFSLGRLPTIQGSPTHLWDGKARLGTYPKLAYSSVLDGAAVTFKALNSDTNKLALRVIYTPWAARNFYALQRPSYGTAAMGYTSGPTETDNYTFMIDYTNRGPMWDELNFIVQHMEMNSWKLGNIDVNSSGSALTLYSSIDVQKYAISSASLEINNLAHLGLDIGLSSVLVHIKAEGCIVPNSALPCSHALAKGFYDDSTSGTDTSGVVYLASLRYHVPVSILNNPFVGVEYQQGNRFASQIDFSREDLTGFYSNRGNGYHLYYAQPVDDNLTVRVGYMRQNQQYSTSLYGIASEDKRNYNVGYVNARLDF